MIDWDDAYANMAHIPGSGALPAQWAADALSYRQSGVRCALDLSYGSAGREALDVFLPQEKARGLLVFVHGGYWMKTSKSDWSHLAQGAVEAGWAVAMPSYTLAPVARIHQMVVQIAQAIEFAASKVEGPIRLAGHSAGGHLVSRMVCADTRLGADSLARLEHVMSISGLHDLRPLMKTQMNAILNLSEEEAAEESAALQRPLEAAKITAWVGAEERPEFVRQAELLGMMWRGFDTQIDVIVEPKRHHFSVVDGLRSASSDLITCLLG